MSSEDARRIRIIVLKATHVPFVALIWTYEHSRQLLRRQMQAPAPPISSMIMNRPISNGQSNLDREGDSLHVADHSALNRVHPLATPTRTAFSSTDASELVSMVQKLSSQVDALTAMVAGQQKD